MDLLRELSTGHEESASSSPRRSLMAEVAKSLQKPRSLAQFLDMDGKDASKSIMEDFMDVLMASVTHHWRNCSKYLLSCAANGREKSLEDAVEEDLLAPVLSQFMVLLFSNMTVSKPLQKKGKIANGVCMK